MTNLGALWCLNGLRLEIIRSLDDREVVGTIDIRVQRYPWGTAEVHQDVNRGELRWHCSHIYYVILIGQPKKRLFISIEDR